MTQEQLRHHVSSRVGATDASLYGLRLRRDRQLRGATVFDPSLDAPVEAGAVAEAGEYCCCVRVQVVAESADAARQSVADDLADEPPGCVIEELQPTGAPIDAAAGLRPRGAACQTRTSARSMRARRARLTDSRGADEPRNCPAIGLPSAPCSPLLAGSLSRWPRWS